jgi:hypothetical protein
MVFLSGKDDAPDALGSDDLVLLRRRWPEPAHKAPGKKAETPQEGTETRPRFLIAAGQNLRTNGGQEKPQDLQARVLPANGEGDAAFLEPQRIIWSRRRQSTSVNGVCQAPTTTSCILLEKGGIKEHNSRNLLVQNGGKPHGSRV